MAELEAAIAGLRVSEPGMTAKEVHERLVAEPQWAELALSAVKKASSKMAKAAAKSEDSMPADAASVPPKSAVSEGVKLKAASKSAASTISYSEIEASVREIIKSESSNETEVRP